MSSRALRKLQGEAGLGLGMGPGEEESPGEESSPARGGNTGFNAFALLNTQSCSESEVKEDDDVESARGEGMNPLSNAGSLLPEKKKKKRRKKTGGKKLATRSSEDNLDPTDEIEAGVRWVEDNIGAPMTLVKEVEEKPSELKSLLSVENKHLNAENEMKRIFGTRVVQNEALSRQRRARGRPHVRSSILVTPKPTWPSAARSGLSMRPIASESPGQWFTLDHSVQYQAVQLRFLAAVDSLNPDQIVALLNAHPMHIDSMLQLSDFCKMGEDSAMAAELVERALYALEAAFHPTFSLASGSCHLDYKRQENRALFIALYRHLHFVGSRACYRTALEICKVLLTLDPQEDPLAIVLLVDFYALRARQFQWLVNLYDAWDPMRNLSQLPNFAYSVALAAFHLSQSGKREDYLANADRLLQDALLAFPSVLLPLLDKCSIEPHPGLLAEQYFLDSRGESPSLATLCSLYVARTFHCWKEPEILPWMEKNVGEVIQRLQKVDKKALQSKEDRSVRYQGLPRNIHRHVLMSEHKEAIAQLPPEMKDASLVAYDPLQPLNSINTYLSPERQPTALDDPSALRMFFRSILPNFNPAEPLQPPLPDGGDGAVGGAVQGADLRNSVNSLLDAMRELLGNLQLPEVPNEGDDEADDGEDPGLWD